MADAIDAIMSRRSIRKYTDNVIPEELITKLLEAGMAAPSAKNLQPWRFVVVDDRKILDKVPEFHPYSNMLKTAPVAICVAGVPDNEFSESFWVQDCSAATQNILLAAHALGLGAVWLGVYPRIELYPKVQELLNLPESIIPLCLISIGYPAEEKPRSDRFDSGKIFRNSYEK